MSEIKTLNGFPLADTTAREGVRQLTEEIAFKPDDWGVAVLRLDGNTAGMDKDNTKTLTFLWGERSGNVSAKWQGSSSVGTGQDIGAGFDNELGGLFNLTLKFEEAFEAKEGWGIQSKYNFKANAIDHTHARNLVSAMLWGQIVKSRKPANDALNALPNGGAVDGFPMIIVLNGKFYAFGTLNIPKDGWMMGMSDPSLQQAILCADGYAPGTTFTGDATLDGDFDLEYVSNEDNQAWMLPSLNRCINSIVESDGTDLDTTVAQYLDIESAIDYYIFTVMLGGFDMIYKNYLLSTLDGVKWFFGAYDMDTTYGLNWHGKDFLTATNRVMFVQMATSHRVMRLLWAFKKDQIKARYKELRETVLSEDNVAFMFYNFAALIPSEVLAQNARRWPRLRSTSASNTAQILNWYRIRCVAVDAEMGLKNGGSTPEGNYTNQVLTAQDPVSDAVYNGVGYKNNVAIIDTEPYEEAITTNDSVVTGLMPYVIPNAGAAATIYVKGDIIIDADAKFGFQLWKNGKTVPKGASTYATITKYYFDVEKLSDGYYKLTPILNSNGNMNIANNIGTGYVWIRWCFEGSGEGLIITFDEPIE